VLQAGDLETALVAGLGASANGTAQSGNSTRGRPLPQWSSNWSVTRTVW
jgi:hypothetical protein